MFVFKDMEYIQFEPLTMSSFSLFHRNVFSHLHLLTARVSSFTHAVGQTGHWSDLLTPQLFQPQVTKLRRTSAEERGEWV